jgi:hypothetical protein
MKTAIQMLTNFHFYCSFPFYSYWKGNFVTEKEAYFAAPVFESSLKNP